MPQEVYNMTVERPEVATSASSVDAATLWCPADSRSDIQFDLNDPLLVDDPYPVYSELRSRCPVAYSETHGGHWVVSRYEDVRSVLRDNGRFSSRYMGIPRIEEPSGPRIPLQSDPPEHGRYRRLL